MIRNIIVSIFSASVLVAAATEQNFTLTGRIEGLQPGDTLRFERTSPPEIESQHAFDIIVEQPDIFSYSGTQSDEQEYLMQLLPKVGKLPECDRYAKIFIVTAGDNISMSGTRDDIYYCTLGGGIYDDPLLSRALQLSDSIAMARTGYLRKATEAQARKDTLEATRYVNLFNNFYRGGSDCVFDRLKKAEEAYKAAHPNGSLYLLVESLKRIKYTPQTESRAFYDNLAPELKYGRFGQKYNRALYAMEALAEGKPAPDFTVTAVDGSKISLGDFKGKYLLIYHWGLCPGSMMIDRYVRDRYNSYAGEKFDVLGLTESIAQIRDIYNGLSEDSGYTLPNGEDMRTTLGNMQNHPWREVETNTGHPENALLAKAFGVSGLPFFIFIDPDGVILARGFSEAFDRVGKILDDNLGGQIK